MLTRRSSHALKHVQVHSSAFNSCSKDFTHKEHSLAFQLAQRQSCVLNRMQESIMKCIQLSSDELKGIHAHLLVFNCHQSYPSMFINVPSNSVLAQRCYIHSSMFSGGHTHSKVFISVRQIKAPWICAQMCEAYGDPIDLHLLSVGYSSMFCDYTDSPKEE